MKANKKIRKGFTAIEIMFSICIFALASIGIFYLSMDVLAKDSKVTLDSQALVYAQEGIEAARNIRDRNFLNLVDGVHGLQKVDGVWSFAPPPEVIDEVYQRKVTVSVVYRNETGDIDVNGTVPDSATKRVDSEVIWYERGEIPRTVMLTAFLSDYRGDDWIMTTCVEFEPGTMEEIITQEVTGPPDDNCYLRLGEEENPGSVVSFFGDSGGMSGNAHSNDVEVDGSYAYLVTRKSPELYVVNISNPVAPSKTAELPLNCGGSKEIFVTKYENYLYVGCGNKNAGLVVVNVSNPASPVKVSTVNVGDEAYKPVASGNYLYVPVANKGTASLKVYNIANRTSPVYVSTVATTDQVRTVDISGNYAYVGLNNSGGWGSPLNTFAIYDVSNPSAVTKVSDLYIGDWVNDVKVSGPMAYLGMTQHHGNNTLASVNINNPASPSISTMLDVGSTVLDLAVYDGHIYTAMDSVHSGLAAVNIANPFSPSISYIEDSGGKSTGIAANDTHLFVSIDTNNNGMAIIERERISISTAGSYVSPYYDTGSVDTLYNYLEWDGTLTPSGSIKFQIRTADSIENLQSASWIGPDGTASTYYQTSRTMITLDPARSGSRYYQYKVYFASDGLSTPFLDSVKLNYTP
jgi:hypothetical protein